MSTGGIALAEVGAFTSITKESSNKSKPKIRVLLAEDHHIVRAGIRQLLAGDLRVIAEAGEGKSSKPASRTTRPRSRCCISKCKKRVRLKSRAGCANLPAVRVLILNTYDNVPYGTAVWLIVPSDKSKMEI